MYIIYLYSLQKTIYSTLNSFGHIINVSFIQPQSLLILIRKVYKVTQKQLIDGDYE